MCPINEDCPIERKIGEEIDSFQHLGGDGVVILVDCVRIIMNDVAPKCLIGIVELKDIPMQTYFDYAEYTNNNISTGDVITIIKAAIAPGSWIIFEDAFYVKEYSKLLLDTYPVIVSRSELERHNTEEQNVYANLTQVWNHVFHTSMSHL